MSLCFGRARSTSSAELLTAYVSHLDLVWSRRRLRNPKQALNGLFWRGNRASDLVNAGASSSCAKMDLARRSHCPCHRAPKHHLANRTRLAHLGVAARYRKEQQKRRSHPLGIFLAANHLDESRNLPPWFGGLIWLLASRDGRRYRAIAFTYLIALAEFIVMHGKNYYLAPAYPMLFAAGGVAFERIFALRFRWLKPAIAFLVIVSAIVLVPVVLPVLPPEKSVAYMRAIHFEVPRTETSHTAALPQLYADQFCWEEMVRSVARVYTSLPANEQKHAAIFCQNYGEAGAIDFFGPKYGLPPALSGHQNYFYWRPNDYSGEIMIVLDDDATDEREQFGSVEDRGLVESSPWAMPWEQRLHIFVCRGLKIPLRELWPKVRAWF